MTHVLKITPQYYIAVLERRKTFEVRVNDRPYRVNDDIILQEYIAEGEGKYTGRIWHGRITYILDDPWYCKRGYVIFSIAEI